MLKTVAPGRYEAWLSLPLVFIGAIMFKSYKPEGFVGVVGFALIVSLAWVMALNTALAFKRMTWAEKILIGLWFPFITWLAVHILYGSFTIRMFADR